MIYFQFLQNENSQLLKFSFNNFQISLSVCQAVSKLIFILPCCVLNHRSGSTFSLLVQFSSILLLTTYRCLISGKRKRKMPGRLSKPLLKGSVWTPCRTARSSQMISLSLRISLSFLVELDLEFGV